MSRDELLDRGDETVTLRQIVERFEAVEKEYSGMPWTLKQIYQQIDMLVSKKPCGDCIRRSDIGLTDFEIIMCNGDYREGLKILLEKIAAAPSVTPMQKWIPVSEKLPPNEEKSYWICTENGYQCQCRWTNTNHIFTYLTSDWHWHIMDIPQYDKVVAWMPLPEPYKQEVEE